MSLAKNVKSHLLKFDIIRPNVSFENAWNINQDVFNVCGDLTKLVMMFTKVVASLLQFYLPWPCLKMVRTSMIVLCNFSFSHIDMGPK